MRRAVSSGVLHPPEIAASLGGLTPDPSQPWGSTTASSCRWVRTLTRCCALDASRPDLRARELGRSARRDVGAMLRRCELELAGIDLWIPPEHYTDPERSERAMETLHQTVPLATELARLAGGRSRPMVSVTLPLALGESERASLDALGDRHGAVIADHTPPKDSSFTPAPAPEPTGLTGLVMGVDPAACLMSGGDPMKLAHHAGALRWSDAGAMGRCMVGSGRLDMGGYFAACLTTGQRWIIADAFGSEDPGQALTTAVHAWRSANPMSRA